MNRFAALVARSLSSAAPAARSRLVLGNKSNADRFGRRSVVQGAVQSRGFAAATEAALADKAREMFDRASTLLAQDKFVDAYPLLESTLEIFEKNSQKVDQTTFALTKLRLAYSYQQLQKNEPAKQLYEAGLAELQRLSPDSRELGVNYLNYAELLIKLNDVENALKYSKDSVTIIRKYHPNDSILAAALSNYAARADDLSSQKRFEEARAPCAEALRIFQRDLGRQNEYTRASFANMYQILKELNANDEIGDLEADYQTLDKAEVERGKGLTSQEVADMTEEFGHSIKQSEPKAMPQGPVKGEKLYKRELNEFFGTWEKRGLDLADPALIPIIEQETEALKNAKAQRKNLSERMRLRREELVQAKADDVPVVTEIKAKDQARQRHLAAWKLFVSEQQYSHQMMTEAGITDEQMNFVDKKSTSDTMKKYKFQTIESELAEEAVIEEAAEKNKGEAKEGEAKEGEAAEEAEAKAKPKEEAPKKEKKEKK